jgi:hypothetical protein
MTRTVTVEPISNKARNRLANLMEGDPVCIVEQDIKGDLFLAASNHKHFFWVSKNDAHWKIVS